MPGHTSSKPANWTLYVELPPALQGCMVRPVQAGFLVQFSSLLYPEHQKRPWRVVGALSMCNKWSSPYPLCLPQYSLPLRSKEGKEALVTWVQRPPRRLFSKHTQQQFVTEGQVALPVEGTGEGW